MNNKEGENTNPIISTEELKQLIEKLKLDNHNLEKEKLELKQIEKELRKKNDELTSLEENYAASLEEARAITDELMKHMDK